MHWLFFLSQSLHSIPALHIRTCAYQTTQCKYMISDLIIPFLSKHSYVQGRNLNVIIHLEFIYRFHFTFCYRNRKKGLLRTWTIILSDWIWCSPNIDQNVTFIGKYHICACMLSAFDLQHKQPEGEKTIRLSLTKKDLFSSWNSMAWMKQNNTFYRFSISVLPFLPFMDLSIPW